MTSNARTNDYGPFGLWPLWQNITPPVLENNEQEALKVFSGVRYILNKYPGIPSVQTLLASGLNWVRRMLGFVEAILMSGRISLTPGLLRFVSCRLRRPPANEIRHFDQGPRRYRPRQP